MQLIVDLKQKDSQNKILGCKQIRDIHNLLKQQIIYNRIKTSIQLILKYLLVYLKILLNNNLKINFNKKFKI